MDILKHDTHQLFNAFSLFAMAFFIEISTNNARFFAPNMSSDDA